MLHGIYKENNGYTLYVNGKYIMWSKYLSDLKKQSKAVPITVKYSDTKTVSATVDYSRFAK